MMRLVCNFSIALALVLLAVVRRAEPADVDKNMLEQLKPFSAMVGSWTAQIDSGKASPVKEKVECSWGYRDADGRVSINLFFEPGSQIKVGLLTFDPKSKEFQFVAKDMSDKRMAFRGTRKDADRPALQLRRADEKPEDGFDRVEIAVTKGGDKLLLSFSKRMSRSTFKPAVTVEAFREGPSQYEFEKGPFCIVTGGAGRVKFEHKGATVHVACEATKELVLQNPEKFLKP